MNLIYFLLKKFGYCFRCSTYNVVLNTKENFGGTPNKEYKRKCLLCGKKY